MHTDHVVGIAPKLKALGIKHLVTDSYYSKVTFVHAVTNLDFHIVGKLRIDAYLKWLYNGEYMDSGRPRQHDGTVDFKKDINCFEYMTTLKGERFCF